MFLQRFTCCLPHSLGCLLPACHDRQFRHQIVFLLHTIQHIHASQMHMISQIKYVFTKIYFNRFPKGGTSRRPLVSKNKTDEIFRVAVRWLSRGCQEAVEWLSGKNHHNFEAKIKFGRWFRYHRRAYRTPSVLTPAKFDLRFRLSRGCSPSEAHG